MIADEVTQNSRGPTNTRWVARAGRVQQYSDTLKGRGTQYDQSAKDFTFLLGIPINHQNALGFAGFRVDKICLTMLSVSMRSRPVLLAKVSGTGIRAGLCCTFLAGVM